MYSLLIVDDEREERDGVEFLIRRRAFPITLRKASNGREALRLLEEGPADILLTDIKMPLMNGLELCAAAREKYPAIVLIILSAYGDYEYTRRAIQVRVDDYILKPVAAERFLPGDRKRRPVARRPPPAEFQRLRQGGGDGGHLRGPGGGGHP